MKKIFYILICMIAIAVSAQAQELAWTGNFSVSVGIKYLDEGFWSPTDEQLEFGCLIDFGYKQWPVNIAIDFLTSYDCRRFYDPYYGEYIDFEGSTVEMNIGIRKNITFGMDDKGSSGPPTYDSVLSPALNVYFGGGIAFIAADATVSGSFGYASERGSGVGYWGNLGLFWIFGVTRNITFGFDIRVSEADVKVAGVEGDAGGFHLGIIAGYHW